MKSGIYKIINLINNKTYIGSSTNIQKRLTGHANLLRKNKHINKHLQSSFNKYGEENFKFEVIEYCEKENLIIKEQFFIDFYKACQDGYNIRPYAETNYGIKHSKETIEKLKKIWTGRHHTEESKKRMSIACKGRVFTKEHCDNISKGKKGVNAWNKGKKQSEKHRKTNSESHKGIIQSDESKLKKSMAMKKYWENKNNSMVIN